MKSAMLITFAAICAFAQDSADVLARILADKGTISAAELARVEGAPPAERVGVLANLLQQKGLLTPSEVARIYLRRTEFAPSGRRRAPGKESAVRNKLDRSCTSPVV